MNVLLGLNEIKKKKTEEDKAFELMRSQLLEFLNNCLDNYFFDFEDSSYHNVTDISGMFLNCRNLN